MKTTHPVDYNFRSLRVETSGRVSEPRGVRASAAMDVCVHGTPLFWVGFVLWFCGAAVRFEAARVIAPVVLAVVYHTDGRFLSRPVVLKLARR
jgi:hypothetical protein